MGSSVLVQVVVVFTRFNLRRVVKVYFIMDNACSPVEAGDLGNCFEGIYNVIFVNVYFGYCNLLIQVL